MANGCCKWLMGRSASTQDPLAMSHQPSAMSVQFSRSGLLDVRAGGLFREEPFPAKTVGRALNAVHIPLARQLLAAGEQSQPAPRLGRRLALVPNAVAVHVDEDFLAVE